jgi:hypothetical protein
VGIPARITIRLVHELAGELPTHGMMGLAFGVPVPFPDYPQPPRPLRLVPLPRNAAVLGPDALFMDAAHPMLTVTGGRIYEVDDRSQTPGYLTVSVPGQPPWTWRFWDYEAGNVATCINLTGAAGPQTVTVSSQYTTGDWFVAIAPAASSSC